MPRKLISNNYLAKTWNYRGLNTFWRPERSTINDIPEVAPTQFIPESVFQFGRRRIQDVKNQLSPATALHFFTDDYRLSGLWTEPKKSIRSLYHFPAVFAPDFTLSLQFPEPVNRWNHYRKMWLSAWWQSQELEVISVANWLGVRSYHWCFEGMPHGSVVAVSANEISDPSEFSVFLHGFKEMERVLCPKAILMIGGKKHLAELEKSAVTRIFCFATG